MKQIKERNGVILAAGIGSRLRKNKCDCSIKPLKCVDDIELLMRAIQSLEVAGCKEIVIVLGFREKTVRKHIDLNYRGQAKLVFAVNKQFKLQNGISVLCARPYSGDEFILTMADHILDENIMKLVKQSRPPVGGASLCVDYKIDQVFDLADATKVLAEGAKLKKIGKTLEIYNCIDTGVFIGTDGLMDAILKVYEKNGDASLSEGIQALAETGKMACIDIKECFWQDVDTPEMLAHAENLLRLASAKNQRRNPHKAT